MHFKQKVDNIVQLVQKIRRKEFPRKIGNVDTLAVCVARLRMLAVKWSVNTEANEFINYAVDAAEECDKLLYSETEDLEVIA